MDGRTDGWMEWYQNTPPTTSLWVIIRYYQYWPVPSGIQSVISQVHPYITATNVSLIDALIPDSKVHGANMGPTWVLSAPDGPHVGPMNLVNRDITQSISHRISIWFVVPLLLLVFGCINGIQLPILPTNQDVKYECFHWAFQIFHKFCQ